MRPSNGKVAVIAGGGGIGGATAHKLAAAGTAVVIGNRTESNALDIARSITEQGGRALGIGCDISDEASVQALVRLAVDNFGGLDYIHINAADLKIIFQDSNALDVDLAVFDHTIAVDLRGYLLCTRAAIPEILKRGGGAIVYTTSGSAFIGEPERPCYGMAKAGVNALMRHVASRWGRQGIRSNSINPGFVLTENNRKTIPQEVIDHFGPMAPSPRLGTPEDIGAMVAFLLSEEAAWVNGQVVTVNGGASMR